MNEQAILGDLRQVEDERQARATDAALSARVHAVKAFQAARFSATYADLLASPRYAKASGFFLEELYGTRDFAERDAQFARIVPAIVRLFPQEIVTTVGRLAALHALSEQLDTAMARALAPVAPPPGEPPAPSPLAVDATAYGMAWRMVGQPDARQRQVGMALEIGRDLDRLTARPLLRRMLRLMRGPATAAGLSELQRFLERGFDTFAEMRGAGDFLATIEQRETLFVTQMFAGETAAPASTGGSEGRPA